jgi:hypothetical protein
MTFFSKGEYVVCPYTMLQRYMRVPGLSVTDDTCLFKPCYRSKNICRLIFKDKPLSYTRARKCLILRLKKVLQDLNVSIHSLLAGGTIAATNAGINDLLEKNTVDGIVKILKTDTLVIL